jgi:hypothetical protein
MKGKCVKKIIITILGIVLTAGLVYAAAGMSSLGNKTYSWRYKMTVEIETPEGIKTGSAVREVDILRKQLPKEFFDEPYYVFKHKGIGEAVPVDLGHGKIVFVLLSTDLYREVWDAFNPKDYEAASNFPVGSRAELEAGHRPRIVTFADLNDPMSVQLVYASKSYAAGGQDRNDHFEELFGKGVKLKSVMIEITDEPVTWGVRKHLPWLDKIKGGYLHGGYTSKDSPLGLYGANFERRTL